MRRAQAAPVFSQCAFSAIDPADQRGADEEADGSDQNNSVKARRHIRFPFSETALATSRSGRGSNCAANGGNC